MKVGFDGVLLGAWTNVDQCTRILDVGTGTGLIALMLAQRTSESSPRPILDAIDLNALAIQDAEANFASSPWVDRMQSIHARFQDWFMRSSCQYELMVSNPPYFQDSVSQDPARISARHNRDLAVDDLLQGTRRLLARDGRLSLILPTRSAGRWIESANQIGLYCRRRTSVSALPTKPPHRELLEFQWSNGPLAVSEMTIELEHHVYTDSFRQLAREFYLAF